MSKFQTRRFVGAAMLGLLASAAVFGTAQAQQYPDRNVTMIVPFPAGGSSDITGRSIAAKLTESLGKTVVVENRAGANGSLGATLLKQAAPDGYTLLVGSIGVFGINPALFPDLKYDPMKDFDLLTVAVRTPNVLVANPGFPANNVKELIEYMKKNPDKVSFASSGTGSSDHLTAELFMQKTGTKGVHVPYKGGGPAIADLIGGHANVSFQNLGAIANHVRGGKLKALAVTADKRNKALPDVPTLAEAGVKDVEVYSWQAAAAPKGLPPAIRARLEKDMIAGLKSADATAKFNDIGFDVVANTGKEFETFLAAEIARWKTVIEVGKIKPE
jgi:tripartite-type tricarboxylate transporter receptor subunit TctC